MEFESKEDEAVGMEEGSSEDSDDSDDDISDEKEQRARVDLLKKEISVNHLYYDGHVALIAALRELGELEEARQAREAMNVVYPLSPELWLDWLRDEQKICTTKEERNFVETLFNRAVIDYTSVQIWVEFVMFMLGSGDHVATRAVCDRALMAVGTHVAEGILVWQVVLLFEKQVYAEMQNRESESDEDKKKKEKQLHRVQSLIQRQARVPLLNADPQELLVEATELLMSDKESQIKMDIEKSSKKLNEKMPFEDELLSCNDAVEKLSIYRCYISRVTGTDNPSAVQSLYERAITVHCLDAGFWEEYVRYVLRQFHGLDYVVLPVCQRSQRNCPWSASLCVLHMRALQLFASDEDKNLSKKMKDALETGLNCGLQSGSEATRMWMGYLVYLRREIDWQKDHDDQLNDLRESCQQAISMIDKRFGEDGDIDSEIPRFWARIEGESAKQIESANEIWNDIIMKRNDNFKNPTLWLEFINLERSYGTEKYCRKLFRRALERVWDNVELIGDVFLRFEQEVGTFETMEDFIRRYEDRMSIVRRKRAEDEAKLEAEKNDKNINASKQKGKDTKFNKKKPNMNKQQYQDLQDVDVFKSPGHVSKNTKGFRNGTGPKNDVHPPPSPKKDSGVEAAMAPPSGFKGETAPPTSFKGDVAPPPGLKGEKEPPPGFKGDMAPPPGFKGDMAPPPGFKGDMAPPPGFKGDLAPPPGFKGDLAPPPGFKGDIAPPPGYKDDVRPPPGYKPSSPNDGKRKREDFEDPQNKKVKVSDLYGVLTDESTKDDLCTAFISNLAFGIDKEQIVPFFSGCGEVKEFRLVRDFKKRSKGYGYLVFRSQEAVSKALEMDRAPLDGRPVYVSTYDPEGQSHHFKYARALEKNKLFIRGLPFEMSQEDVAKVFQPHGEIKEMRLVSYRNGYSKGTCYIEYHNAETAEKVRQATDGIELCGKVINVVISNPPSKDKPFPTQKTFQSGESKGKLTPGVRKKGMFDLMPRSLMQAAKAKSSSSSEAADQSSTDAPIKPKSNEDFRNMLLKK